MTGAGSAGGASAVLLRYLREQNRPYSAQDAFGNLQREHGLGKAAVVKALEQLAQQGRVREKVYGKQKIYFADQEQLPAASDAELRGLDGEIAARSGQLQALQQSCRHMEAGECARRGIPEPPRHPRGHGQPCPGAGWQPGR